jgi:hypothetical protein
MAVGFTFNVEVFATTSILWEAYQVTLHYDDAILDGVTPNPDQSWNTAPVEGVHGGNRFSFTTTPAFCTPSTQGTSRFLEDDSGQASWAVVCTEDAPGTNHTGEGALVQFAFKCEAPGTANLTLTDINDTYLLDAAFTPYNDAQQNATIVCQ